VLVEHLIVSHHGQLEFGSPKVPLFPEAMLLHHLDNLDSKMECMRALEEKDRHIEGCWTGYSPSLDRSILKKSKFLEDAAPGREVAARQNGPVRENTASTDGATAETTKGDVATGPPGAAADHPALGEQPAGVVPPGETRLQPAVERHQRFAPSASPFAEKLQQAWRKDP
jgi:3'-5' exoribonuclease